MVVEREQLGRSLGHRERKRRLRVSIAEEPCHEAERLQAERSLVLRNPLQGRDLPLALPGDRVLAKPARHHRDAQVGVLAADRLGDLGVLLVAQGDPPRSRS